jgi:UDP-glucose 4-epimerase
MYSNDCPRRFLVTGGAGFIGSHLVSALLARGNEVVALDDLSSGSTANLEAAVAEADANPMAAESTTSASDRLTLIEASLLDYAVLARAVDGTEAVLHQAAIPSVPRSFDDPVATMRANVEGTTALLEECRKAGVRRVAMASSSSVYGDTPTLPKEESMAPSPMSPYALSKLSAEYAGDIYARTYGLEVYALRYFNIFGPRQDPNSEYSAVIPKFITSIREGRAPVIYGDGEQSRDFTFIDNVVSANLRAVGVEGEVRSGAAFHAVNIGCGERYSLLELMASLNTIMGTNVEPRHEEARPGDVRHSHASIDRARAVLGYEPRVGFDEGLRRTVEFFAGVAVSAA